MLAAVCVALGTILKIGYAFFPMFGDDVALCVFMAAITGVGCVIGWMTGYTRDSSTLAMIQGEGMISSERGGGPGGGSMAGSTICAELAKVFDRLCVAGDTGRLCADKDIVKMAAFAFNRTMRSRQREVAQAMVKGYAFPILWCVAGFTLGSKFPVMFILLIMAGITILRRGL